MAGTSLTLDQRAALVRELDATSTLFRHGFKILREYRYASRDVEAVFVCLGGGAEKLLKLSLGLMALDAQRPWPSRAAMKDAGHRITQLDEEVRGAIGTRVADSTAPGLIRGLLDRAEENPGVDQILRTLERYAQGGRFHNLDVLAGVPHGNDDSPHALWEELQMMVVDANPELLEQLAGPEYDDAQTTMNRIVAAAFGLWCELLQRAWITGVCGSDAAQWGGQLDLGHPEPKMRL